MSHQQDPDMGIRETINKRQRTTAAIVVATIAVAIGVVVWSQSSPVGQASTVYYADETGNGVFADDANKVYPFDHQGKAAYRAFVYECSDGKQFVSYIARYNDAARGKLHNLNPSDPAAAGEIAQARSTGIEVKKPGDAKWVPVLSREGDAITTHPTCPDGSTARSVSP